MARHSLVHALRLDEFDEAQLHRVLAVLAFHAALHDGAWSRLQHRASHQRAVWLDRLSHPQLDSENSVDCHAVFLFSPETRVPSIDAYFAAWPKALISTSTPGGRSSFISASTVSGVGSRMSISRLCVRISNCSRDFLSTCGERSTVQRLMVVGSGMGPATSAPVRFAVSTISRVDWSRMRWSYAFKRMRILSPCLIVFFKDPCLEIPKLLEDFGDGAGAHRVPAFADGEAQTLLQRHRRDQSDLGRDVVPRHHHLHPRRQLHIPGHVRRTKIKLRPVAGEKRRMPPALFLRQYVRLRLELRVRRDTPRLAHHLPSLHLVLLRPPQQQPNVVPPYPFVQQLAEHLHSRHHLLHRRPKPHDLHFLPHLHLAPLYPPRHHRPAPRYRKRSEEHTSELQSRPHLVCRLLLEKKKKKTHTPNSTKASPSASRRQYSDMQKAVIRLAMVTPIYNASVQVAASTLTIKIDTNLML